MFHNPTLNSVNNNIALKLLNICASKTSNVSVSPRSDQFRFGVVVPEVRRREHLLSSEGWGRLLQNQFFSLDELYKSFNTNFWRQLKFITWWFTCHSRLNFSANRIFAERDLSGSDLVVKSAAAILSTFIAILQSQRHTSRSSRLVSRY